MTATAKICEKFGLAVGKMSYSDTRRIVNHASKPFYVSRDGMVTAQFGTAKERTEWLEQYAMQRGDR